MSYNAIVSRVHTRPHPNADKLQLGTCNGYQVVVGLDTRDGELGVFFPCDGQLSEEFILANNLYSESARLKMGLSNEGITSFGFFSEKRRVRAQSFRGQKSDGFWGPLSYFSYIDGWSQLLEDNGGFKEGETFSEINGHEICQKYFTPATLRAQGKVGRKQRENKCFPKHDVTKQFKHVAGTIPSDAVIYITEKLHGTSGRYGRVLEELEFDKLPWWKRLLHHITEDYPEPQYVYLNGSKNVILEKTTGPGYYGTNEFRYKAIEGIKLHKGEILYFEIVGYVGDRLIMAPQPIKDEVKSLRKQYGDTMRYTYGQQPGQCDIYVYKIVRVNEDGVSVDLSWPQVVARCHELGLKHVPVLFGPMVHSEPFIILPNVLQEIVDKHTEGPSTVDPTHIREGVVLRVESPTSTEYIKNKSWAFGFLEGYLKDSDDFVDIEEAS